VSLPAGDGDARQSGSEAGGDHLISFMSKAKISE
jgi:hypothetical protein